MNAGRRRGVASEGTPTSSVEEAYSWMYEKNGKNQYLKTILRNKNQTVRRAEYREADRRLYARELVFRACRKM